MKTARVSGIVLAAAVAGLFSMVSVGTAFAGDDAKVKCENSSACKGTGSCKTTSSSCKGTNACKGHGMTMQTTDAACKKAQEDAKKAK
jgi:hypothetical protein